MFDVRLASLMAAMVLASVPGCAGTDYQAVDEPRGEVNGRSFEFVSTKPDGTEWTFRVRGNALWVGYVEQEKSGELGSIQLTGGEQRALWELIDVVDVGGRRKGRPDPEHGTVVLRLREPGARGRHQTHTVNVSRRTDDDDVIALANAFIDLVEKHKKVSPAF